MDCDSCLCLYSDGTIAAPHWLLLTIQTVPLNIFAQISNFVDNILAFY